MNGSRKYIVLASFVCVASIIAMIVALCIPKIPTEGEFIPPPFEGDAVCDEPNPPTELDFIEPYAEGMEFRAGMCGKLVIEGGTADVYFTNKNGNNVWLMLRITDETGNILAETGILRPGEYVKSVDFNVMPEDGQKVVYKVMAYEPDTYYSAGYFTLKTVAHITK